ncbi:MAG TPA: D-alanyl-D-alanine carboxypeptidase family protein, partial [Nannocystis exedens]|nr:D-alanyl-D-alanine carboxypeptidase family protein [Nannocystis exedens]
DLRTPIDREHGLHPEWAPDDLVALDVPYVIAEGSPPNLLRASAAEAFTRLSDAAFEATGVRINIRSGYRTFALQCSIFRAEIRNLGCVEATRASARAGFSEHQLGTTADLAIGWRRLSGDAPIDAFLDMHAHEYGWVLSYPQGAEQLTGYKYEPWHYRYLGTDPARDLVRSSGPVRRLSTQEYLMRAANHSE